MRITLKEEKDREFLEREIFPAIDRIKFELWQLSSQCEENGYIGKAKKLKTIGSMLEDWEHRR